MKSLAFVLIPALALTLAAGQPAARADMAYIVHQGGTALQPRFENPSVAMAWEEVDLTPTFKTIGVKAVFGMKNTSDKDVTVEVGFPVTLQADLADFTVTVAGAAKPEVKRIESEKARSGQRDPAMPEMLSDGLVAAWLCWTMTFPAGREQRVEVSYTFPPETRPTLHGKSPPEDLKEKTKAYVSSYIVRTGRGWAGPIGRGVFRVHWSREVPKDHAWVMAPPWYRGRERPTEWQYDPKANVDTLTMTNFEPDDTYDIEFIFKAITPAEEVALLTAAIKKGQLGEYENGENYALSNLVRLIDPSWILHHQTYVKMPMELPPEERQARLIEVLEYCIPPLGPKGLDKQILDGRGGQLQDSFYFKAFKVLLTHYEKTGQKEKAAALAKGFGPVLEAMITFGRNQLSRPLPDQDTSTAYYEKTIKEAEAAQADLRRVTGQKEAM
jgi:hypothetical protein